MKIIEYMHKTTKYIKGYTLEEFCDDEKTIDVTVFSISQIGELVKIFQKKQCKKILLSNGIG